MVFCGPGRGAVFARHPEVDKARYSGCSRTSVFARYTCGRGQRCKTFLQRWQQWEPTGGKEKREPSQGREICRTCSERFELLSTGAERSPRSTSQRRPQAKAQDRRSAEALYALQTPRLTYFLDSNKSIGIISKAALIVN